MAPDSFCVFVLSHGRPHNVLTLRPLLEVGRYSGPWFLVVDDEDPTLPDYRARYGEDRVLVFSKEAVSRTFDPADLSDDRRTVVYARNACWDLARERGYDHFLQLDDDYPVFRFRFERGRTLTYATATDLDRLFRVMLRFLADTRASAVALGQGGDYVAGVDSPAWQRKVLRKAMNTFFCRTADRWRFPGRVNEDVNAYTSLAHRGHLFLTTLYATVNQTNTQASPGGMTGTYLDGGTYVKSFYSVMMCPSAVRVAVLRGRASSRLHHAVNWNRCAPLILPQTVRKVLP